MLACDSCNVRLTHDAVTAGASLEKRNNHGMSAFCLAAAQWKWPGHGHTECMRILVKAGADVNAGDAQVGYTPLHYAARNGSTDLVYVLVTEMGANVNIKSNTGHTALTKAMEYCKMDTARVLIENGADVTVVVTTDGEACSPLSLACLHGDSATALLLLDKECDVSSVDRDGRTPLDWALEKDMKDVENAIRAKL